MTKVILDIGTLLMGISGAILVGNINRWGYILYLLGSICTGIIAYHAHAPFLVLTSILFGLIDIYYWNKWKKT